MEQTNQQHLHADAAFVDDAVGTHGEGMTNPSLRDPSAKRKKWEIMSSDTRSLCLCQTSLLQTSRMSDDLGTRWYGGSSSGVCLHRRTCVLCVVCCGVWCVVSLLSHSLSLSPSILSLCNKTQTKFDGLDQQLGPTLTP